MAIRLADTEDRRQIYQSRRVAKVIECQQQAVFQSPLSVFPSPSGQRVEGFLFVQVSRQLSREDAGNLLVTGRLSVIILQVCVWAVGPDCVKT